MKPLRYYFYLCSKYFQKQPSSKPSIIMGATGLSMCILLNILLLSNSFSNFWEQLLLFFVLFFITYSIVQRKKRGLKIIAYFRRKNIGSVTEFIHLILLTLTFCVIVPIILHYIKKLIGN